MATMQTSALSAHIRPAGLSRWRQALLCGLAALLGTSLFAAEPADRATAEVERLLEAVGGRTAWAVLRGTINDSQQYRVTAPNEVRAVITMDFREPRFRIETTAPALHLIRVMDGASDWRLSREGRIERMPPSTREGDLRWYAGHLYRSIHRIAARDPALSYRLGGDGRLEVFEGQTRIIWFRLTSGGEPYAFGSLDDEAGNRSGPWKAVAQGIKHPIWTSNADGTWRSTLNKFSVLAEFDPSILGKPQVP